MSDDIKPIDLLAGEYVLGLLEGEERVAATLRAETDPDFRVRVEFWEMRLASLLETLEERPAPAGAKARIEAALFGKPHARPKAASSLWLPHTLETGYC
jgi:anti-sigma-K factor RskA